MVTIQAPTIGRVVIFTALYEERKAGDDLVINIDTYPGIITRVHADGVVDLVTFGPGSIYHNLAVPHCARGKSGTWAFPLASKDTIEVPA